MPSFNVFLTIGELKGIPLSDKMVVAVWEMFDVTEQTPIGRITPIFDATQGNVGVVTWNESVKISSVLVDIDSDAKSWLAIAFWEYETVSSEPRAIGVKKIDISDFHVETQKVLCEDVELNYPTEDGSKPMATISIQLRTEESDGEEEEAEQPTEEQQVAAEPEQAQPEEAPQEAVSSEPPTAEPQAEPEVQAQPAEPEPEPEPQPEQQQVVEQPQEVAAEAPQQVVEPQVQEEAPPQPPPAEPEVAPDVPVEAQQPAEPESQPQPAVVQPDPEPEIQPVEQPPPQEQVQPPSSTREFGELSTEPTAAELRKERVDQGTQRAEAAASIANALEQQAAARTNQLRDALDQFREQNKSQAVPAEPPVQLTAKQKSEVYADVCRNYGKMDIPADSQPLSSGAGLPVQNEALGIPEIMGGLLAEGADSDKNEHEREVAHTLVLNAVSGYLSTLPGSRQLHDNILTETIKTVHGFLRLPEMTGTAHRDETTARYAAFAQATQLGLERRQQAGRSGKIVMYFPATEHNSNPEHPIKVESPEAVVRLVPLSAEGQMDTNIFQQMLQEDDNAGNVPTLVCVTAGYDRTHFGDNIPFIQSMCQTYGLVFHIEGQAQILMATDYEPCQELSNVLRDANQPVSLCLYTRQLFLYKGPETACHITFTRIPTATPIATTGLKGGDLRILRLYIGLRARGKNNVLQPITQKLQMARYLLAQLQGCEYVQLLTEPSNLLKIRFRLVVPGATSTDENHLVSASRLVSRNIVQTCSPTLFQLVCVDGQQTRDFEWSLLWNETEQADVDLAVGLITQCGRAIQSTIEKSPELSNAVKSINNLIVEPRALELFPLSIACFRYVPSFYLSLDKLETNHIEDVNAINLKLLELLKPTSCFSTLKSSGQVFVVLGCSPYFNTIFTPDYTEATISALRANVEVLENSPDVVARIEAEVTKRGIKVAEQQLKEMQQESKQQSVFSMIPIIGNWWSVPSNEDSLSFDLRTSKFKRQDAYTHKQEMEEEAKAAPPTPASRK